MSNYLFVFSISPVQGFIEQARKTQDLYTGSYILSHLCRAAIKQAESHGARIIFPNKENRSIPNRFMAEIGGVEQIKLKEIGENIEKSLRLEWLNMGKKIETNIKISAKLPDIFWQQLETYWLLNWCFVEANKGNYAADCKNTEVLFGSLKNARLFKQIEQIAGRKCLLSGEENAVLWCGKKKPSGMTNEAVEYTDVRTKKVANGEALGAIAIMKRFSEYCFKNNSQYVFDSRFPSVAKIAFGEADKCLKKYYSEHGTKKDIEVFLGAIEHPAVFAVKNKREQVLLEKGEVTSEDINNANKYSGMLKEAEIAFPSPYYAVLLYDGDSMGKWLAGEHLQDKTRLKEFQVELSHQLGKFAENTVKILNVPRGKVVYAGGDDFLGIINIEHLFAVLTEMKEAFDREINISGFSNKKLTFSAGITFAHYKAPLRKVLAYTRKMEKEAKNVEGKDALGIAVLKHSGEIEKAVLRWHGCTEKEQLVTAELLDLLAIFKGDKLSSGFISSFYQGLQGLGTENVPDKIVKSELRRLLKRATSMSGKEMVVEDRAEFLFDVYLEHGIVNLFSLLNIIRFLLREVKN